MKAFIKTYGCTLNQADSDAMRGVLLANGVDIAEQESGADVIVLNTCAVKQQTQQKVIEKIRRLEGRKLVVAGCLVGLSRELVEKHAPKASLLGTSSISGVYNAVQAAYNSQKKVYTNREPEDKLALPRARNGVIARIPISEGCASNCSFCATKLARVGLHSYDEGAIINEVKGCVKAGYKEIQLTSQDAGAYGLDKGTNVAQLMGKIDGIDGNFLVRVGMMNPEHVARMLGELVAAFQSNKIYKFLHIPLQSGNNKVLRDMGRLYTVEKFLRIASEFRRKMPEMIIATDVIAGYPTESENAFGDTLNVLRELKPEVVNISRFTPRPNTRAAALKRLPNEVVNERTCELSRLCREIGLDANRKLLGKEYRVLLTEKQNGSITGRNPSYRQVVVDNGSLGDFINVKITGATHCYLKGVTIT